MKPSATQIKVGWQWVMQWENDPKETYNSGRVKVQTLTRLKVCAGTLRELCISECSQTSTRWSNVVKKSGLKFLQSNTRDWSHTENVHFKLLLLEVLLQAIESLGVLSFSHTGSGFWLHHLCCWSRTWLRTRWFFYFFYVWYVKCQLWNCVRSFLHDWWYKALWKIGHSVHFRRLML